MFVGQAVRSLLETGDSQLVVGLCPTAATTLCTADAMCENTVISDQSWQDQGDRDEEHDNVKNSERVRERDAVCMDVGDVLSDCAGGFGYPRYNANPLVY